jgi:methylase of polypeptide subunit release factors
LGLSTALHASEALKSAIFTDLSSDALEVAQRNYQKFIDAELLERASPPIQFIECSLMNHKKIRKKFEETE